MGCGSSKEVRQVVPDPESPSKVSPDGKGAAAKGSKQDLKGKGKVEPEIELKSAPIAEAPAPIPTPVTAPQEKKAEEPAEKPAPAVSSSQAALQVVGTAIQPFSDPPKPDAPVPAGEEEVIAEDKQAEPAKRDSQVSVEKLIAADEEEKPAGTPTSDVVPAEGQEAAAAPPTYADGEESQILAEIMSDDYKSAKKGPGHASSTPVIQLQGPDELGSRELHPGPEDAETAAPEIATEESGKEEVPAVEQHDAPAAETVVVPEGETSGAEEHHEEPTPAPVEASEPAAPAEVHAAPSHEEEERQHEEETLRQIQSETDQAAQEVLVSLTAHEESAGPAPTDSDAAPAPEASEVQAKAEDGEAAVPPPEKEEYISDP
ncbi:hypothetical protein HK102_007192 [Quaeritorhiza haematococci]|nr:hypothetical protein HK102_007192 [Quaeritorhiza haematococci]